MWLHEKYTRESFAVDAKLIGAFFFFGVEWVFISQQVKRTYCVSKQLKKNEQKYLLWVQKGKPPDMLQNKAGRRSLCLGWWLRSVSSKDKLPGQNPAAPKAKMEQGEGQPRHPCEVDCFYLC